MGTNVPRRLSRAAPSRCPRSHCSACPSCPLCPDGGGNGKDRSRDSWHLEGRGVRAKWQQGTTLISHQRIPTCCSAPPLLTPGDVMALPAHLIVPTAVAPWEPHPTSTDPLATGSPQLRPHAQLCFFLLLLLPLGPCLKPRSSTLCQSQWGLRVCVTPRPPATKQPPQSILQREPRPHPGGPNPKHPPVTLPPSQAGPDSKHPPQTHRCPHSEAPSQVPCKDTRMSQSQVTPDPKHPKGEGVQQHLPLGSPSCRPQAGQEGCPLLGEPHV